MSDKWGWWGHNGSDSYTFDPAKESNDFNKLTVPTNNLMIKLGNDFGPDWIKHTDIPHNNWFFWDNPEVPHLLYPNSANLRGLKDWIRLVPHDILTKTKDGSGTERVNRLLSKHAGHAVEWQDIVNPQEVTWSNSKRVLVCPSSPNCYSYYYNMSKDAWVAEICRRLKEQGYVPIVRGKPTRTLRSRSEHSRLYWDLAHGDYVATVSQHSVSAMESILAGVPAVVTGPHPCGNLATTFDDFLNNDINLPRRDQVEDWVDALLYNTRHKEEMRTGSWRD